MTGVFKDGDAVVVNADRYYPERRATLRNRAYVDAWWVVYEGSTETCKALDVVKEGNMRLAVTMEDKRRKRGQ